MVILFSEGKKKRFYSLLALGALAIILGLAWIFVLRNLGKITVVLPDASETREQKIKIDFTKLENQKLKDLEPFQPIAPPSQQLGRENPFVPYSGTSTEL